ncbi:hypothetical protein GCM10010123_03240 [Pilimelia anulata]|uniref:Superoxide dismutase copper/zinc binding domain-containing protein n=1 Tax=Pilimelia anulata TaxID=53371 RepID=A0A8J3AZG1_9ACTN|nr:superoxide dismutase family protein [Pilimelia anulata]GGJ76582.1 hypothetical protein GCM10010123_03240 [Pilimelia anulata]
MQGYGRVMAATLGVALGLAAMAPATAAGPRTLHGSGKATDDGAGGAFRHDPKLVPDGTSIHLTAASLSTGVTRTTLTVRGLLPNRTYGAHLHAKACTTDPAASGPHYQHEPSTDPHAANPRNEVWLDVTTDANGTAVTAAENPWELRAAPGALVIHADPTNHDHNPGQAGARVACLPLTAE